MERLKTILCYMALPAEGSLFEEDMETCWTEEEWDKLTATQKEEEAEIVYQEFRANYLDGGYVLDEGATE